MLGRFRWNAPILVLSFLAATMVTAHAGQDPPQRSGGFVSDPEPKMIAVSLNGSHVSAVIADTDATRTQGLLGWERIEEGQGMLLDFLVLNVYAIHMQGMRFPIDAVWIDESGVIKLVYEDIKPDSGYVYPSLFPCRYCLEIKAGYCKKHGVKAGQKAVFGTPTAGSNR